MLFDGWRAKIQSQELRNYTHKLDKLRSIKDTLACFERQGTTCNPWIRPLFQNRRPWRRLYKDGQPTRREEEWPIILLIENTHPFHPHFHGPSHSGKLSDSYSWRHQTLENINSPIMSKINRAFSSYSASWRSVTCITFGKGRKIVQTLCLSNRANGALCCGYFCLLCEGAAMPHEYLFPCAYSNMLTSDVLN